MTSIHDETVRPEFDPASGTYQVHHDGNAPWAVSTTVVLAVASVTGDDPLEMLPLHLSVDTDALESHVGGRDRDATMSFEFHDYRVTVRDDGHVEFAPLEET